MADARFRGLQGLSKQDSESCELLSCLQGIDVPAIRRKDRKDTWTIVHLVSKRHSAANLTTTIINRTRDPENWDPRDPLRSATSAFRNAVQRRFQLTPRVKSN